MVYETGEVVSLLMALVGYLIILIEFRNNKKLFHLSLAYTLLLVGALATVVEGFYFKDFFNLVEHVVGMALAGVAFSVTAFLAHRRIIGIGKLFNKKIRVVK